MVAVTDRRSPVNTPARPAARVAVIVATRDRVRTLSRTLDRLCELPDRPQIVVVDNGSRDGTGKAVTERGIELIEAKSNLGTAARNVGARAVETPYVAFADDDSWWEPGALTMAADLFDRHSRLGLIAGRVLVGGDRRLDPTCAAMTASPLRARGSAPGKPVLGFVACGAIVRRSAFLAVGGFGERFGIGGEETLLALDLAAAGWEASYVDDVIAHHHPEPSPHRARRGHVMLRNALWTTWLRRPPVVAAQRTASLLASEPRLAPRALVAALGGLGWVARERRVIPRELELALRSVEAGG